MGNTYWFNWKDITAISRNPNEVCVLLGLAFETYLGDLDKWLSRFKPVSLMFVQNIIDHKWLDERQGHFYSRFNTRKTSISYNKGIVYNKYIPSATKAYYYYLASIIPPYADERWIPAGFVDSKYKLLEHGLIDPYLNGYILVEEFV